MTLTATSRAMLHGELMLILAAFKDLPSSHDDDDAIVAAEPSTEPEVRAECCCICLEAMPSAVATEPIEVPETAQVALSCGHAYCKGCIQAYVASKIDTREVQGTQLTCPVLDCRRALDAMDILRTTTEAVFLKYLHFTASIEFEKLPHGRHCPNPKCNIAIECDPSEKTFVCHKCSARGCFKCGNASHPFRTCSQALDSMYVAWEKATNASSSTKAVAPCPSCGYRIWKNDGCQHMTCQKCRHEWCWTCNITWRTHNNWMAQRYCHLAAISASPQWGPCLPIRVVTQSIALTLVTAGVFAGGAIAAAGLVVGIPLALLYLVPRELYRKWRRGRFQRKKVQLHYLAEKVQRGTHVYVHTTADDVVLPDLATTGDWRHGNAASRQYVAYVGLPVHGSFVVYLSSRDSTQLAVTPGYFRAVLMPSATATLPPPEILNDLVPSTAEERTLTLVYDADATVLAEMQHAVSTLEAMNIRARILFVQRPETATPPAYMSLVYTALFNAAPRPSA
ncbi:hypothetical protein SPRG_01384 [Saprolegnia parasitica CBS 223.65]|uniref:RBR-type E3 ubiquitin transferase n=1 Tax=Saprolegnia parasitica (strain CBS 223.65) TaxID=695850 RepID=A0A067CUD1_SAPPC|nr:hypothetical protein SPRG_01384 [Saprolegnia parasitica CBS 223.65]KDO34113.1 hypothetical protein SPRG_01384 [Saprolegnia parasitica CBS 223.65]|eukprot:XP_012194992.1 hypothetical protein SPRG_01384 [Saprolegnia parasitica CBS 223.65]